MTYPHGGAGQIWRDGNAGAYNPKKSEIRIWGGAVETAVSDLQGRDFAKPNPKAPVAAVASTNLTLAGEQVIDGVLTDGSRVLLLEQDTAAQNGVWTTAPGAWQRAEDCDTGAVIEWATVFVSGGTFYAGTEWICSTSGITIDVDKQSWVQVGGGHPTLTAFNAALMQARRQFEFDAERWFRAVFLTQNFTANPVAKGAVISFETSAMDGAVKLVVLPSGAAEPTRGEISAGTDGVGLPAIYADALEVASLDVVFDIPRILANGTGYDIYAFHENAAGDLGRRHKASFTTPLVLYGGAYDGTVGDLAAVVSESLLVEGQTDPNGGVNAILLTDDSSGSTGIVGARVNAALPEGAITVRCKVKKISGSFDQVRLGLSSFTQGPTAEVNLTTGFVQGNSFAALPLVTDLGDGWFEIVVSFDPTGWADRAGSIYIYMRSGSVVNVPRDGTQALAIYDVWVEN